MNRTKVLYQMQNINRNIKKINLCISELEEMCEIDEYWKGDAVAEAQIYTLLDELKNDSTNVRDSVDFLKDELEKSLANLGYVREHGSYGNWVVGTKEAE